MCIFCLNMTPWCHGRGDRELGLAGCPSGPTQLVRFHSFLQIGARQPECSGKIAPWPPRPVSLFLIGWLRWLPLPPVALTLFCQSNVRPPLGVASGPRRRSLAQSEVRRLLIRFGSYLRRLRLPVALDRRRWNNVCHSDVCTGWPTCLRDSRYHADLSFSSTRTFPVPVEFDETKCGRSKTPD